MKTLLAHKFTSILSLLSLLLSVGGFVLVSIKFFSGSGPFVLHYNDITGITAIGGPGLLFFMGIFGIVISIVNGAIALEFESRDHFLGKFIAVLTIVFSALLFIAFASIIAVN